MDLQFEKKQNEKTLQSQYVDCKENADQDLLHERSNEMLPILRPILYLCGLITFYFFIVDYFGDSVILFSKIVHIIKQILCMHTRGQD